MILLDTTLPKDRSSFLLVSSVKKASSSNIRRREKEIQYREEVLYRRNIVVENLLLKSQNFLDFFFPTSPLSNFFFKVVYYMLHQAFSEAAARGLAYHKLSSPVSPVKTQFCHSQDLCQGTLTENFRS